MGGRVSSCYGRWNGCRCLPSSRRHSLPLSTREHFLPSASNISNRFILHISIWIIASRLVLSWMGWSISFDISSLPYQLTEIYQLYLHHFLIWMFSRGSNFECLFILHWYLTTTCAVCMCTFTFVSASDDCLHM